MALKPRRECGAQVSTRIEFAHLLRGVAAGAVVISHLAYLIWRHPEVVGGLIAYPGVPEIILGTKFVPVPDFGLPYFWGYFGVALFFLISGFVIPFSVSSLSRSGFAINRLFRIWPTYLVGLTIAIAAIAMNSALSKNPFPYSLLEVLTNALIVPRWPTLTRSIDGINWTLEIEILFYATCMVLMTFIRNFDLRIFLLAALVVPSALFVGLHGDALIRIGVPFYALADWAATVPVYVCFMLCGVAFYFHYRNHLNHLELYMVQAFLLLAFVASMRGGPMVVQGWTGPISCLISFGVFAVAYFARDALSALPYRWRRPFHFMADISYPLYAVHGVLGYTILVHVIEAGVPAWGAIGIAFAAILSVAVLVHRLVELPSQSYGKALAAKMDLIHELKNQCEPAAVSRVNVATASATGPKWKIRPWRR